MRTKISYSSYNDKDKSTCVTKQCKYGTFSSFTIAEDEDLDVANQYTGFRLGEYKCDLQILEKKIKQDSQRTIGIANVIKAVQNSRDNWTEEEQAIIDRFVHQYNIAKRDLYNEKELYKKLRENYINYADAEIEYKRKLREKKIPDIDLESLLN